MFEQKDGLTEGRLETGLSEDCGSFIRSVRVRGTVTTLSESGAAQLSVLYGVLCTVQYNTMHCPVLSEMENHTIVWPIGAIFFFFLGGGG